VTEETTQEVKFADMTLDIKVTTPEQVILPVKVKVEYPEGYGLWAVQALARIPEYTNDLYYGLAQRQDASVMGALLSQVENQDLDVEDKIKEVDMQAATEARAEEDRIIAQRIRLTAPDAQPDPVPEPEPAPEVKKPARKRAPRKTPAKKKAES
jgi:hypothetical protein